MADDVIKWDAPLNDQEDIQWENTLQAPIAKTPYQVQTKPYQPKLPQYTSVPMFSEEMPGDSIDAPPMRQIQNYTPGEMAAAKEGVDIDTKAPGRFAAGFGDPLFAYSAALQKKFGYLPELRQGPQSGQIEYRLRGSSQWVTTGEPYPVLDIASGAGAVAGAVGGGLVGGLGGPAGVAFLGSSGAILGGMGATSMAHGIGKMLGYTAPEHSAKERVWKAGEEALTGELLGFGMVGAGKGVRWMFKGSKPFTAEEAGELLNSMRQADDLVNEIRQGSGQDFNLSAYQVASGPNSATKQSVATAKAGAKQGQAEADPKVGPKMEAMFQQQQSALTGYFKNALGEARKEAFDKQGDPQAIVRVMFDPYQQARQLAKQEIEKLPADAPEEQISSIIRNSIEAAQQDWEQNVSRPAWQELNQAIGADTTRFRSNVQIPWTDTARALEKSWKAEQRATRKQTGGISESSAPALRIPKGQRQSTILDSSGNPIAVDTGQPTVDLMVLNNRIQDLRKTMRQTMSGDIKVQRDNRKYNQLVHALEDMRDSYLEQSNPQVKGLLDKAEGATKQGYSKFDTGITRDMLVVGRNGNLRLTNGQTLADLLKSRDVESIRNFANNVNAYPQARDAVNQMLYSIYRQNYTKNGIPTPGLQARFNKDYGPVMDVFFGAENRDQLERMGGLAQRIGDEYKTIRKMMPGLKGSMGGEVEAISPEIVVNNMFSSSWKPQQLEYAIGAVNRYPYADNVFSSWKSGVADEMYRRLLDPKTGNIQINRLDSLLAGDNATKIERLFNATGNREGTKLINGLKNLRDASILAQSRGIGGLTPSQATALTDLARVTYARPLTREGVIVSALARARSRAAPERIYKALTDPAEMERLSKQIDNLKKQLGATAVVGSLNTYDFDN